MRRFINKRVLLIACGLLCIIGACVIGGVFCIKVYRHIKVMDTQQSEIRTQMENFDATQQGQSAAIVEIITPKMASGSYTNHGIILSDIDNKYRGQLNNEKRYLALGFDDFRESDFSLIIPLLNEYDARATFNRIANEDIELDWNQVSKINSVLYGGNELGDHTWFHCNFIYSDPMFNGQNPNAIEGNQIPYPSNDQMRTDYGNGKNAFGFDLTSQVNEQLSDWNDFSHNWSAFESTWGGLTDEQCQQIREHFSIMCDKSGMLDTLDLLSNLYLGTEGSSYGSWSDELGCYTGGIYSGSKTSANHEIWERILEVTEKYYESQFGIRTDITTWSWSGSIQSPFMFEKDGIYYYDEACTKKYNYLARMESSLYKNLDGSAKNRSWVEALREYGYTATHDSAYPSRFDGLEPTMMEKQFIYNAALSRKDALLYPTNSVVSYSDIARDYPEEYFNEDTQKSLATQMYEGEGIFYDFIEALRCNTSNGMIQGEVIDSADTYSEKVFLEALLQYCRETGVEVITKAEAYDICFNYKLDTGNLIYNPYLRNTAEEFMSDADNLPTNPDGYEGKCYVIRDDDTQNVLVTEGEVTYNHYGIPLGNINYSALAKGDGNIKIYAIYNKTSSKATNEELELLAQIDIDSEDYQNVSNDFYISNYAETEYEQQWEGMGDKIMGIKIVYSDNLLVKNMQLTRK